MPSPKYLRRTLASQYLLEHWGLQYAPKTLAKLAVIGGGPVFQHAGRIPYYTVRDLDRFAEGKFSKPKRSTSDSGEVEQCE
jgi:hypothetical protein